MMRVAICICSSTSIRCNAVDIIFQSNHISGSHFCVAYAICMHSHFIGNLINHILPLAFYSNWSLMLHHCIDSVTEYYRHGYACMHT